MKVKYLHVDYTALVKCFKLFIVNKCAHIFKSGLFMIVGRKEVLDGAGLLSLLLLALYWKCMVLKE